MENKLIVKINKDISIRADSEQYIVRNKNKFGYFGELDSAFIDIFECLVRERLMENEKKEMKEIAKIVLDTKKEILKILSPFVNLKD